MSGYSECSVNYNPVKGTSIIREFQSIRSLSCPHEGLFETFPVSYAFVSLVLVRHSSDLALRSSYELTNYERRSVHTISGLSRCRMDTAPNPNKHLCEQREVPTAVVLRNFSAAWRHRQLQNLQ